MECDDAMLLANRDWDPSYLSSIFYSSFDDLTSLWAFDMEDSEFLEAVY